MILEGGFAKWLYSMRVKWIRWEEDEGAGDESPIQFNPCGMFVTLRSISGASVRQ